MAVELSGAPQGRLLATRLVDAVVDARVVVLGSLPPEGRDLDVLARGPERGRIVAALEANGFVARGPRLTPTRSWVEQWVRFEGGEAFAVDLHPPERWGVSGSEIAELFAAAVPIEGMQQLARLAPQHVLLLAARRFLRSGGRVSAKQRERIERALAEDPTAWASARDRAPRWGVSAGLALLERAHATDLPVPRTARLRAQLELVAVGGADWRAQWLGRRARSWRPRRTAVVSLSGLDGAGKSTQAAALRETFASVGADSVVEWMPLGHSPRQRTLRLVRTSARRVLAARRRVSGSPRRAAGVPADRNPAGSPRQRSELVTQGWATTVSLIQALEHRRAALRHFGSGKIIIFDRYTLDSAAQLRFFYGAPHRFAFQKRLIRWVSPTPTVSFLLDVPPETLRARKKLEYTFDEFCQQAELYKRELDAFHVRRLDGERPEAELRDEIAASIWRRVGR